MNPKTIDSQTQLFRTFKRVISCLTVVTFLFQTVSYAAPVLRISEGPAEFRATPVEIEIPRHLGEIQSAGYSSVDSGLVVQIQDAHGNLEAQRNIEKILNHLREHYGIRLFFLEGSAGELHPDRFHFFKEHSWNLEVVDRLMKQGHSNGMERFLLAGSLSGEGKTKRVRGYGIEEPELYRNDINLFRAVMVTEEKREKFFDRIRTGLRNGEGRNLSGDLRMFVKEWKRYEESDSEDIPRFMKVLCRFSEKYLALDLKDPVHQDEYPSLVRILKMRELESALDTLKIREEADALAGALEGKVDGKLLKEFRALETRAETEGGGNPRFLLERLYEQAKGGIDFRRYPNFSRWAARKSFWAEIKAQSVFDEIETLIELILARLVRTDGEQEAVLLLRDFWLTEKLLKLDLIRQDYDRLIANRDACRPSRLAARLAKSVGSDAKASEKAQAAEADSVFENAVEFYRLAVEREKTFQDRILGLMKKEKQTGSAVLIGGFHAQGLETRIRETGMSYVSIQPRITNAEQGSEIYLEAMMSAEPGFQTSEAMPAGNFMTDGDLEAMWGPEAVAVRARAVESAKTAVLRNHRQETPASVAVAASLGEGWEEAEAFLRQIPLAEGHAHFGGSIHPEDLWSLALMRSDVRWDDLDIELSKIFGQPVDLNGILERGRHVKKQLEDGKESSNRQEELQGELRELKGRFTRFTQYRPETKGHLEDFVVVYEVAGRLSKGSPEIIEDVARRIALRNYKEGVRLLELRTSMPREQDEQKLIQLTLERLLATIRGLRAAENEVNTRLLSDEVGLETKIIVTIEKYHSMETITKQVQALLHILEYYSALYPELREYVVGFDVANAEQLKVPPHFTDVFKQVKDYNRRRGERGEPQLGLTYHVGEDFENTSVESAIRHVDEAIELGVNRIGHGLVVGVEVSQFLGTERREHVSERLAQIYYDLKAAKFDAWRLGKAGLAIDTAKLKRELRGYRKKYKQVDGVIAPLIYSILRGSSVDESKERRLFLELLLMRDAPRYQGSFVTVRYDENAVRNLAARQNYVLNRIAEREIVIEANPTSNVFIGPVASYGDHPLRRFLRHSFPNGTSASDGLVGKKPIVTINTDDSGIFGTSLFEEYVNIAKAARLSPEELRSAAVSAFKYRFSHFPLRFREQIRSALGPDVEKELAGYQIVETAFGKIQFTLPFETLRDLRGQLDSGKDFPVTFVLPPAFFRGGINYADLGSVLEFFAFTMKNGIKINLVLTREQMDALKGYLEQTMFGVDFDSVDWKAFRERWERALAEQKALPQDAPEVRGEISAVETSIRAAQDLSVAESGKGRRRLSDFVNFIPFEGSKARVPMVDARRPGRVLGEVEIIRAERDEERFTVREVGYAAPSFPGEGYRLVEIPDPEERVIDVDYRRPYHVSSTIPQNVRELLAGELRPRFGYTVLDTGEAPGRGHRIPSFIVWIGGKGILVDPTFEALQQMELLNLTKDDVPYVLLTNNRLGKDSALLKWLFTGKKTTLLTSFPVYFDFLKRAETILGQDIERAGYVDFVPLLDFTKNKLSLPSGEKVNIEIRHNPTHYPSIGFRIVYSRGRSSHAIGFSRGAPLSALRGAPDYPGALRAEGLRGRDLARVMSRFRYFFTDADGNLKRNVSIVTGRPMKTETILPSDGELRRNYFLQVVSLVSLLSEKSPKELREILDAGAIREFTPQEIMIEQGTYAREGSSDFIIILSGDAAVIQSGKVLAYVHKGTSVGELALVTGEKRGATVRAISKVTTLALTADQFDRLIRTPEAEERIRRTRENIGFLEKMQQNPRPYNPFEPLSYNALAYLAARAERRSFTAGQVVLRQGDKAESVFIIKRGRVGGEKRIKRNGRMAWEKFSLKEDDYFGEIALMTKEGIRTATISAETDVELLEIHRDFFESVRTLWPEFNRVIRETAERRDRNLPAPKGASLGSHLGVTPVRVLMLDDDKSTRSAIELDLHDMGEVGSVASAATTEEALEAFTAGPEINFILTDFQLGNYDTDRSDNGVQFLRQVFETRNFTGAVVILSAEDSAVISELRKYPDLWSRYQKGQISVQLKGADVGKLEESVKAFSMLGKYAETQAPETDKKTAEGGEAAGLEWDETVSLPLLEIKAEELGIAPETIARYRDCHVIIADDKPFIQDTVRSVVGGFFDNIHTVGSVDEVLAQVKQLRSEGVPDEKIIVLCDYEFGSEQEGTRNKDGYDALHSLRMSLEAGYEGEKVDFKGPFIFVSGSVISKDQITGYDSETRDIHPDIKTRYRFDYVQKEVNEKFHVELLRKIYHQLEEPFDFSMPILEVMPRRPMSKPADISFLNGGVNDAAARFSVFLRELKLLLEKAESRLENQGTVRQFNQYHAMLRDLLNFRNVDTNLPFNRRVHNYKGRIFAASQLVSRIERMIGGLSEADRETLAEYSKELGHLRLAMETAGTYTKNLLRLSAVVGGVNRAVTFVEFLRNTTGAFLEDYGEEVVIESFFDRDALKDLELPYGMIFVVTQILANALEQYRERKPEEANPKIRFRMDEKTSELWIEIEDEAGGIAPEILPDLFKRTFTTKKHGTGYGLYWARRLMEMFGGSIEAENAENGALFRMKLPLNWKEKVPAEEAPEKLIEKVFHALRARGVPEADELAPAIAQEIRAYSAHAAHYTQMMEVQEISQSGRQDDFEEMLKTFHKVMFYRNYRDSIWRLIFEMGVTQDEIESVLVSMLRAADDQTLKKNLEESLLESQVSVALAQSRWSGREPAGILVRSRANAEKGIEEVTPEAQVRFQRTLRLVGYMVHKMAGTGFLLWPKIKRLSASVEAKEKLYRIFDEGQHSGYMWWIHANTSSDQQFTGFEADPLIVERADGWLGAMRSHVEIYEKMLQELSSAEAFQRDEAYEDLVRVLSEFYEDRRDLLLFCSEGRLIEGKRFFGVSEISGMGRFGSQVRYAKEKGRFHFDASPETRLWGKEFFIENIFLNLFWNAPKDGDFHMRVSEEGNQTVCRFTFKGEIDPATIFEPKENRDAPWYRGALIRDLVRASGGEIEARNDGENAVITIRFPLPIGAEKPLSFSDAQSLGHEEKRRKETRDYLVKLGADFDMPPPDRKPALVLVTDETHPGISSETYKEFETRMVPKIQMLARMLKTAVGIHVMPARDMEGLLESAFDGHVYAIEPELMRKEKIDTNRAAAKNFLRGMLYVLGVNTIGFGFKAAGGAPSVPLTLFVRHHSPEGYLQMIRSGTFSVSPNDPTGYFLKGEHSFLDSQWPALFEDRLLGLIQWRFEDIDGRPGASFGWKVIERYVDKLLEIAEQTAVEGASLGEESSSTEEISGLKFNWSRWVPSPTREKITGLFRENQLGLDLSPESVTSIRVDYAGSDGNRLAEILHDDRLRHEYFSYNDREGTKYTYPAPYPKDTRNQKAGFMIRRLRQMEEHREAAKDFEEAWRDPAKRKATFPRLLQVYHSIMQTREGRRIISGLELQRYTVRIFRKKELPVELELAFREGAAIQIKQADGTWRDIGIPLAPVSAEDPLEVKIRKLEHELDSERGYVAKYGKFLTDISEIAKKIKRLNVLFSDEFDPDIARLKEISSDFDHAILPVRKEIKTKLDEAIANFETSVPSSAIKSLEEAAGMLDSEINRVGGIIAGLERQLREKIGERELRQSVTRGGSGTVSAQSLGLERHINEGRPFREPLLDLLAQGLADSRYIAGVLKAVMPQARIADPSEIKVSVENIEPRGGSSRDLIPVRVETGGQSYRIGFFAGQMTAIQLEIARKLMEAGFGPRIGGFIFLPRNSSYGILPVQWIYGQTIRQLLNAGNWELAYEALLMEELNAKQLPYRITDVRENLNNIMREENTGSVYVTDPGITEVPHKNDSLYEAFDRIKSGINDFNTDKARRLAEITLRVVRKYYEDNLPAAIRFLEAEIATFEVELIPFNFPGASLKGIFPQPFVFMETLKTGLREMQQGSSLGGKETPEGNQPAVTRDVRRDLAAKLDRALGGRYDIRRTTFSTIDIAQEGAGKGYAVKDFFSLGNYELGLYFGDEFYRTPALTGNDYSMVKAKLELEDQGRRLILFSVDMNPESRSEEARAHTIWIGSGPGATRRVLSEILEALESGAESVVIRGKGMDSNKRIEIDLRMLVEKGMLASDIDGTLFENWGDGFSVPSKMRKVFTRLLTRIPVAIISGNSRVEQKGRISDPIRERSRISNLTLYFNEGMTRMRFDASRREILEGVISRIPEEDIRIIQSVIREEAKNNFGLTREEISAWLDWLSFNGEYGVRADYFPNIRFVPWIKSGAQYNPTIIGIDQVRNSFRRKMPLVITEPYIESHDTAQISVKFFPGKLDLPDARSLGDDGQEKISYRQVDMGGYEEIQFSVVPERGETAVEQFENCLRQIREALAKRGLSPANIVTQNVFLRAESDAEHFAEKHAMKKTLESFYGEAMPAVNFIGQFPVDGKKVTAEFVVLVPKNDSMRIEARSYSDDSGTYHYKVAEQDETKWVYAGGLQDETKTGTLDMSQAAFAVMNGILAAEGLTFSGVVRQWNYIEDIVGLDGERQKYQIFNDVRADWYSMADFIDGYPAATGIGTSTGGVVLAFTAFGSARGDSRVVPLKNPQQIDAHRYTQEVLVGVAVDAQKQRATPKFERAKAVVNGEHVTLFISGTAGIRGQQTVAGGIEEQTEIMIENIEALISRENLEAHGVHAGATLRDVAQIRVYVKQPEDTETVRRICAERFPGIPALFLVADVCRPNLLAEMEGIAFTSLSESARSLGSAAEEPPLSGKKRVAEGVDNPRKISKEAMEELLSRTHWDKRPRIYFGTATVADGWERPEDAQYGLAGEADAIYAELKKRGVDCRLEFVELPGDVTMTRHFASFEYDYYLAVEEENAERVRDLMRSLQRESPQVYASVWRLPEGLLERRAAEMFGIEAGSLVPEGSESRQRLESLGISISNFSKSGPGKFLLKIEAFQVLGSKAQSYWKVDRVEHHPLAEELRSKLGIRDVYVEIRGMDGGDILESIHNKMVQQDTCLIVFPEDEVRVLHYLLTGEVLASGGEPVSPMLSLDARLSALGISEPPDKIFRTIYDVAFQAAPDLDLKALYDVYSGFKGDLAAKKAHSDDSARRTGRRDGLLVAATWKWDPSTREISDFYLLHGPDGKNILKEHPLLTVLEKDFGIKGAFIESKVEKAAHHPAYGAIEHLFVPAEYEDFAAFYLQAGGVLMRRILFGETHSYEDEVREGVRVLGKSDGGVNEGNKEKGFLAFEEKNMPYPPGIVLSENLVRAIFEASRYGGEYKNNPYLPYIFSELARAGIDVQKDFVAVRSNPKQSMPGILETVKSIRPEEDLMFAIRRSAEAWNSERAKAYRQRESLPDGYDLPLIVQRQVRGYSGGPDYAGKRERGEIPLYCAGVFSTRDPNTNEKVLSGVFLENADGDELMTKGGAGQNIQELERIAPEIYRQLLEIAGKLETKQGAREIEFVVENGKLWLLQNRRVNFSPQAEIAYIQEQLREGKITEARAIPRLERLQARLKARKLYKVKESATVHSLAAGVASTAGALRGRLVWDGEKAKQFMAAGEPVIFVSHEKNREDVLALMFDYPQSGLITSYGNGAAHEAVLCRLAGIPSLINLQSAEWKLEGDEQGIVLGDGTVLKEGDVAVVDGDKNALYGTDEDVLEENGTVTDASYGINIPAYKNEFLALYLNENGTLRPGFSEERLGELNGEAQRKYDALTAGPDKRATFVANLEKHFLHELLLQASGIVVVQAASLGVEEELEAIRAVAIRQVEEAYRAASGKIQDSWNRRQIESWKEIALAWVNKILDSALAKPREGFVTRMFLQPVKLDLVSRTNTLVANVLPTYLKYFSDTIAQEESVRTAGVPGPEDTLWPAAEAQVRVLGEKYGAEVSEFLERLIHAMEQVLKPKRKAKLEEDQHHGLSHAVEMVDLLLSAVRDEHLKVDRQVLIAGAWLHDIGKGRKQHELKAARKAGEILPLLGWPEERIEKVRYAVMAHRWPRGEGGEPATTEALLVRDFDKLCPVLRMRDFVADKENYCRLLGVSGKFYDPSYFNDEEDQITSRVKVLTGEREKKSVSNDILNQILLRIVLLYGENAPVSEIGKKKLAEARAFERLIGLILGKESSPEVQREIFDTVGRTLTAYSGLFSGNERDSARRILEDWQAALRETGVSAFSLGVGLNAVDAYGDFYGQIRESVLGVAEITEADLQRPRNFLGSDGQLKSREERRQNGTFGITEVYFLPESETRARMAVFQQELKREFGDKIYLVDEDKLHFTSQGLEIQWEDRAAGKTKTLAMHDDLSAIDPESGAFAEVRRRALKIPTRAVRMQVSKANWNPSIGIFWELRPYLENSEGDPIMQRRAEWNLPQPRPPHVTTAYFAQPFSPEELTRLRALIAQYQQPGYFGDIDVNELQVIGYEDYSFNAGYRVLETVPLTPEIEPVGDVMKRLISAAAALEIRRPVRTILVAEDEAQFQAIYRKGFELLAAEGIQVIYAENGKMAFHYLKEHPDEVDLLITDRGLPYVPGEFLVTDARELSGRNIPVFFISGADVFTLHQLEQHENAIQLHKKYFSPETFAAIMEAILTGNADVSEQGQSLGTKSREAERLAELEEIREAGHREIERLFQEAMADSDSERESARLDEIRRVGLGLMDERIEEARKGLKGGRIASLLRGKAYEELLEKARWNVNGQISNSKRHFAYPLGSVYQQTKEKKRRALAAAEPVIRDAAKLEIQRPVRTILVAEDSPSKQGIYREGFALLTAGNIRVIYAENGKDALEYLREHSGEVDMLITDRDMPGMNGEDLVREARGALGLTIPVFFISGMKEFSVKELEEFGNAIQLHKKNFSPEPFAAIMRTILTGDAGVLRQGQSLGHAPLPAETRLSESVANLMGQNVVVTGAAGHIGSVLLHRALQSAIAVTPLFMDHAREYEPYRDFPYENNDNVSPQFARLPDNDVQRELVENHQTIFHLGGRATPVALDDETELDSVDLLREALLDNVLSTAIFVRLAEQSRNRPRIVFASSFQVYDLSDRPLAEPVKETDLHLEESLETWVAETAEFLYGVADRFTDRSAASVEIERYLAGGKLPGKYTGKWYALSKILAERIMARYENGLSLRLAGIYGPGLEVSSLKALADRPIERWVEQALAGEGFRYVPDVNKHYVYIEDAVRAILNSTTASLDGFQGMPKIINVGSPTLMTSDEIAETVLRKTGLTSEKISADSNAGGGSPRPLLDLERMKTILKCDPAQFVPLDEGIDRHLAWVKRGEGYEGTWVNRFSEGKSLGATLESDQLEETARAYSERMGRAGPEAVTAVAEQVTFRIYYVEGKTVALFYKKKLGLTGTGEVRPVSRAIRSFNEGVLSSSILEKFGVKNSGNPVPVIAYVDGLLTKEAAEKVSQAMKEGDFFLAVWNGQLNQNKIPPAVEILFGARHFKTETLREELADKAGVSSRLGKFGEPPVIFSSLSRDEELALDLGRSELRIKFHVRELAENGIDLGQAIALVKQIAEDPRNAARYLDEMGIPREGNCRIVGKSFARFIETFWNEYSAGEAVRIAA